jgi:general secretion pathway protein F/type IV pilus assembly protein PilC
MPLFHYQAYDAKGKSKKGYIEARTEQEARDRLREMGVMVKSVGLKTKTSSKQNLHPAALYTFTLQLYQLVSAGVPLYESLVTIEKQSRSESYHRIIMGLCEQIKAGNTLSQAMANYPDSFDTLYCSMVNAGESVGALENVLEKLCQQLSHQIKLRGDLITALVYPGILALFSIVIIIMLLGFVVPSIEEIFAGRELNGFTQFVLSVSHFFRDYWWLYIPGIAFSIGYAIYFFRQPKGRLFIEKYSLKVPILRTTVIEASVTRFSRTMATLLQGGLPLIDSLKIACNVMRNVVLADEIKKAEKKIIEGSSLGKELSKSKWFPSMVAQMLMVGEESGSTTSMFNKIADIYEQELEKTLNRLMSLVQPVILIFMGAIIGSVLLAILLPLTDVSSLSTSR